MYIKQEIESRVDWIKDIVTKSGADGVVYGNSGGKDSALVGILCSMAINNVTGIVMPCESKRNYNIDREHAYLIAEKYGIRAIEIDLTESKQALRKALYPHIADCVPMAYSNINPRLRMIALYAYAQTHNCLVAGTGNLSEAIMGYFTKWGDGAHDFNPIADLTVSEIYEILRYLDCPEEIINKAPSAGLYEGQTDEEEMGITYKEIDSYIRSGICDPSCYIEKQKRKTEHKRKMPICYGEKICK